MRVLKKHNNIMLSKKGNDYIVQKGREKIVTHHAIIALQYFYKFIIRE